MGNTIRSESAPAQREGPGIRGYFNNVLAGMRNRDLTGISNAGRSIADVDTQMADVQPIGNPSGGTVGKPVGGTDRWYKLSHTQPSTSLGTA
jgi:hypothetical protein